MPAICLHLVRGVLFSALALAPAPSAQSATSIVEAKHEKLVDARSDTVIDCGPSTHPGFEGCLRTIRRVLALLPRRPERIQVVNPNHTTVDLKARLQHIDGFAEPAKRVVYLNERGEVFGHALQRAGVWDYVLAIVVWHEMAHIDGASEPEAQRREEDLWQQFIVSRKVDAVRGLGYLNLLRKRRSS